MELRICTLLVRQKPFQSALLSSERFLKKKKCRLVIVFVKGGWRFFAELVSRPGVSEICEIN